MLGMLLTFGQSFLLTVSFSNTWLVYIVVSSTVIFANSNAWFKFVVGWMVFFSKSNAWLVYVDGSYTVIFFKSLMLG